MTPRKVKYARLHTAPHFPYVGNMEIMFPPNGKTLDGLVMLDTGTVLDISFVFKGSRVELRIPHANVQCMQLEPEEAPKTKK